MFKPWEVTTFYQDSAVLERNLTQITNELSELVINTGRNPSNLVQSLENPNNVMGASYNPMIRNRSIVPIQEHTSPLLTNDEDQCYSCQGPQMFDINHGKRRSNSIAADAVCEYSMTMQVATGARYKRRASASDAQPHEALLCAAIDEDSQDSLSLGTQAKRSGLRWPSYYDNELIDSPINYDDVVIDLKAIGLSTENREANDVLHLFGIFRKLHYYLNDVIPHEGEPDLSDYPKVFVKPMSSMICTMNVQSQVKNASYRASCFCYRMFDKLDGFKMAEPVKYLECTRSIFILRKLIKQLEPFKTAEFEHKQGAFVNSFGIAQAKNLEILLWNIIERVRECNIYVEVYIWSVKRDMDLSVLPTVKNLRKAVAIAGAILANNSTQPSAMHEIEDNPETKEKPNQEIDNNLKNNGNGNGGGIAGTAHLTSPRNNGRGIRFIGV